MTKKQMWIRLPPSYTKEVMEGIKTLSALGLNKTHISKQLKIPMNCFNKYKECQEAFEDGRSDLAVKCAKSFSDNLTTSYSDRVHLSKALRLYSGSYTLEPVTDMKSAQRAMSASLQAFADNTISIEDLEVVRKSLASYIDSVSSTLLEEKIKVIEETLNERRGVGNGI